MRLLYLTDLHFRTIPGSLKDALDVIEKENPNVLLLGGDYESWQYLWLLLKDAGCPLKRKAYFILGNNDEFEITQNKDMPGVLLDLVEGYVKLNGLPYNVYIVGISRNFSLREKPWSITTQEAISRARKIRKVLPEEGMKILLLHEVPIELIRAARAIKPDLRFNPHIAETASKVAELIDAQVVLVGHLHIPNLEPLTLEIYHEKQRVFILATWVNKHYVVIDLCEKYLKVEVKKYPNMSTLITKKVYVK